MSRNRRRSQNQVPIRTLSPWFLIAAILLVGCLAQVYFKNQAVARGAEIKNLEREISETREQNKALYVRIMENSSRTALQRRVKEGFVKLVPIAGERLVHIRDGAAAVNTMALAVDEVRPVANAGGRRP